MKNKTIPMMNNEKSARTTRVGRRFFIFHFSFFILLLSLASCGSDSEVVGEYMTVSETEISLEADETFHSVDISARAAWQARLDIAAPWLRLKAATGVGGSEKLTFETDRNTTHEARQAVIVVRCQSQETLIRVTQQASEVDIMAESDVPDFARYYKPREFASMDMLRSDAKWSWFRSRQSPHFVVFWEAGFGSDPNAETLPAEMRVDIDDLLAKAERFYATNIDRLHMCVTGQGRSQLDRYKMEIYLLYQTEWLATGSGYDNVIGALWVNPSTCQPVGSVIAHEIGHSFQYQTYCDNILSGKADDFRSGFRYGYDGSNGGCGFWEQCAQWQSFQDYPEETLTCPDFDVWMKNHHRHFEHEWQRYASYWLQYLWTEKHGQTALGRIWNESQAPEDAIGAYTRIFCGGQYATVRSELFEYAQRSVTFDFAAVRGSVRSQYDRYTTTLYAAADGFRQPGYEECPSTTGFNVIPLDVPKDGTTVTATLRGLAAGSPLPKGDAGQQLAEEKPSATVTTYNNVGAGLEGWAYGFVALGDDGVTRHYSPMHLATVGEQKASFTVPAHTARLWLVVQGSPKAYRQCPWDEKEATDDQWPYQIKIDGTSMKGYYDIDTSREPKDITLSHEVKCDAANTEYTLATLDLLTLGDVRRIAEAFAMQPADITAATAEIANGTTATPAEGRIVLGLKQPDGTISYAYTANAGFYCKADGSRGSWADNDPLWFEYDRRTFTLTLGHYPGKTAQGHTYTLRPTLTLTRGGKQYHAIIEVKMKM